MAHHYDIFRGQLAIKYPAYGHALWEPRPGTGHERVEIGDVGFIREGQFHRLLNALLPEDHPSHHEFGVPPCHELLVPSVSNHINTSALSRNHYCSAGITIDTEPDIRASKPEDFPEVSFYCTRKQGGAVLSIPVQAQRQNTLALGEFGRWMVKQIDHWFAFAQRLGLGIVQMEEIVFVTGYDCARSWTNIVFLEGEGDARVSFGVELVGGCGPDASIRWHFSPERIRGALLNQGPEGKNLSENQCIFVRGFRVNRILRILPKQLKAAGGVPPDFDECDNDSGTDTALAVLPLASESKYRDPLHLLLDYVAERALDSDMALVHDDDLARIIEICNDTSPEGLQLDTVMAHFRRSSLEVHQARVTGVLSATQQSSDIAAEVVLVAAPNPVIFHNQNTGPASSSPPIALARQSPASTRAHSPGLTLPLIRSPKLFSVSSDPAFQLPSGDGGTMLELDKQALPVNLSQVVEGSGESGSRGTRGGLAYGEASSGKGRIEPIKIAKGKRPDPIRTVLSAPTLPIATGNRVESMSADSPPASHDEFVFKPHLSHSGAGANRGVASGKLANASGLIVRDAVEKTQETLASSSHHQLESLEDQWMTLSSTYSLPPWDDLSMLSRPVALSSPVQPSVISRSNYSPSPPLSGATRFPLIDHSPKWSPPSCQQSPRQYLGSLNRHLSEPDMRSMAAQDPLYETQARHRRRRRRNSSSSFLPSPGSGSGSGTGSRRPSTAGSTASSGCRRGIFAESLQPTLGLTGLISGAPNNPPVEGYTFPFFNPFSEHNDSNPRHRSASIVGGDPPHPETPYTSFQLPTSSSVPISRLAVSREEHDIVTPDHPVNKTYSFDSPLGNVPTNPPHRGYDKNEHLYQCSWTGCTKSYATLPRLNAHIIMQRHGNKRTRAEFKELRKQWRKANKEESELLAGPECSGATRSEPALQYPSSRGRRLERRDQSPSLSFSPTRSRSSSMSLDELLLEATDNKRTSPSSPQPAHAHVVPPSYYRPVSSIPPLRSLDYRSPHSIRRDTMSQPNVASPPVTSTTQAPPQPPPQPQPHSQYQTLQTHIFAPPVTDSPGEKAKASESTPVSAVPSARSVAGVNSLPSLPPGGFPAVNDKGQRICRQCGLPGRYKDGKCVEKWGPGPEGPGTVCDRCRKKMKRVERRGTLGPHSQAAAFVHPRTPAPTQERDQVHRTSTPQRTDRTLGRTDTVVVSHSYPIPGSAHSLCPVSTTPISKGKSSSTAAEHNQSNDDDDDVEILLPPLPSSSTRTTPSSSAHPMSKRKAQVISPVQGVATPEGQQPRRRKTIRERSLSPPKDGILARIRHARG